MAEPRPERPKEAGKKYTYIRPILESDLDDDSGAEQGFLRMWNHLGYRIGTVFETENEHPGQKYVGIVTHIDRNMLNPPKSDFAVIPARFFNTHFTQNETAQSGRNSLGGRRKTRRNKSSKKYKKHYSRKYKK